MHTGQVEGFRAAGAERWECTGERARRFAGEEFLGDAPEWLSEVSTSELIRSMSGDELVALSERGPLDVDEGARAGRRRRPPLG